jgi:hypothetical protein
MDGKRTEACGRCAMSTVIDATGAGKDGDERSDRDPFAGARIEIDESGLRAVSPAAWLGGIKGRLDEAMSRLVYRK